jgi:hypothetical protein
MVIDTLALYEDLDRLSGMAILQLDVSTIGVNDLLSSRVQLVNMELKVSLGKSLRSRSTLRKSSPYVRPRISLDSRFAAPNGQSHLGRRWVNRAARATRRGCCAWRTTSTPRAGTPCPDGADSSSVEFSRSGWRGHEPMRGLSCRDSKPVRGHIPYGPVVCCGGVYNTMCVPP